MHITACRAKNDITPVYVNTGLIASEGTNPIPKGYRAREVLLAIRPRHLDNID